MGSLHRFAAGLAILSALSSCAGMDGPVFGDWRGRQPTGGGAYSSFVNLVLHGAPGDRQGEYDIQAYTPGGALTLGSNQRNVVWGDRWTLVPAAAAGMPPLLHLRNLPNSQISTYALMPDGVLVPVDRAGRPDLSRDSLAYALTPVPRNSRAYGRL